MVDMLNLICQDASLSDEDKVKRLQDTIFSSESHGLSGPTEKEHLASTLRDLLNRQAALPYGTLLRYAVERAVSRLVHSCAESSTTIPRMGCSPCLAARCRGILATSLIAY